MPTLSASIHAGSIGRDQDSIVSCWFDVRHENRFSTLFVFSGLSLLAPGSA
jgi:hypothetical protein